MINFDGSYLVLRLNQREDLTYGKVYTIMESFKAKYAIKEYSCKQATLE